MSDEQLAEECISNNHKAQKELYDRFAARMMGVCLRYTRTKEDAEDIMQEGFIKVFKKIDTWKRTGSLEGWMRKIMINIAIEQFRLRKDVWLLADLETSFTDRFNENVIMEKMGVKELLNILREMPVGYRIIFNMFAIEGYSHKEIADQLNITEGTSKSQYARAKEYLQKALMTEKV
jgi:RNA polymerase sigma-70 factor (ECF subfamily)